MYKTKIKRLFRKNIILFNFRWKVHLLLGRFYHSLKRAKADYEYYLEVSQNKQNGPLSKERMEQITTYQVDWVNVPDAQRRSKLLFTEEMLNQPMENLSMQNKGTKLLHDTLNIFQDQIKCVANIGARVDTALSYLGPKFPDIQFISVDFQPNLDESNSFLPQSQNRSFLSGYALHLLQENKFSPDLIFMTSTSVLFNNKELDAYFDEFSKSVKIIVLNEPWWPKVRSINILKTERPENIPPNNPYCAGIHANYHHNYIHKLENRGYEIISSEIILGQMNFSALQIVAKKQKN